MTVTTVEISTPDGPMGVYDVVPDGAAAPAVVVLQEAFGVNAHIRDVTRRVAAAGYRAVAPHLFHRTGDPELGYEDMAATRPHLSRLTREGLLADLDAVLGLLAGDGIGAGRVGVVGFCMGGSVALLAAASHELGAAVTFYGGGVAEGRFGMPPLLEMAPDLRTPWLGLFGDTDPSIPVEQVERLRSAAGQAPVPTEVVRYADAGHAFHCDARPANYVERAARDGWARALAWFGTYLAA